MLSTTSSPSRPTLPMNTHPSRQKKHGRVSGCSFAASASVRRCALESWCIQTSVLVPCSGSVSALAGVFYMTLLVYHATPLFSREFPLFKPNFYSEDYRLDMRGTTPPARRNIHQH